LRFAIQKWPANDPHPAREPLHTPNWPKPVRRIYKKERQKPLN